MKTTIKTDERIFQVTDYEGKISLCNLVDLGTFQGQLYFNGEFVKGIKHYWNFEFKVISKIDVLEMIANKNLNY